MRNVFTLASVFLFLAACADAQATEINPGLWELTMQGAPKVCITPEMAADMKGLAQSPQGDNDCKTSDEKVSGNTRTFHMSCTKPDKYDGTISLTVNSADNFTMATDYTGVIDGKAQKGSVMMNYRRVGECP